MRNSIEREYRAILNQMAYLYELRFNLNVEKEWKQYVELTTELEVLTSKLDELEDCLMLFELLGTKVSRFLSNDSQPSQIY